MQSPSILYSNPILLCSTCKQSIPYITLTSEDATILINCSCLESPITMELSKYLNSLQYNCILHCNCFNTLHKKEAEGYCVICHQWLCLECLVNHKANLEQQHHPLLHNEFKLSCIEHQIKYQWYCNDCCISICKHCTKKHQTHYKEDLNNNLIKYFNEGVDTIDIHLEHNKLLIESFNKLIDQSKNPQSFNQIKKEINRAYENNLTVNLVLKDYCILLSNTGEFLGTNGNYNYNKTLKAIKFNVVNSNSNNELLSSFSSKKKFISIEENYAKLMKYFLNEFIISPINNKENEGRTSLVKNQDNYHNLKCITTITGLESCVYSLIQLHDEQLASSGHDQDIKIWSIVTSECTMTLKGHKSSIYSIIQLNDERLVSGSNDTTIKFWLLQERNFFSKIFKSQYKQSITVGHPIICLIQLHDGLLASGDNKGMIRLYNVTTYKCIGVLEGHTDAIRSIIQLKDNRIVSTGDDKEIILWDATNKKSLGIMDGHSMTVRCLVELEDGTLASASDDRSIRLWDLTRLKVFKIVKGHADVVRRVMQLRDGRIVTSSNDQTIRLWDAKTLECISIVDKHNSNVNGVIQLVDGTIASFDGDESTIGKDVTIRIWVF